MSQTQRLDPQELDARMKAVQDYVTDCQRRVSLGEIMDLNGLDQNVIVLCETVSDLPPVQARGYEGRMVRLIESLDELASLMRAQQAKLGGAA